ANRDGMVDPVDIHHDVAPSAELYHHFVTAGMALPMPPGVPCVDYAHQASLVPIRQVRANVVHHVVGRPREMRQRHGGRAETEMNEVLGQVECLECHGRSYLRFDSRRRYWVLLRTTLVTSSRAEVSLSQSGFIWCV